MTTAHEFAEQNATQFREQLHDLLRIPSISTDPKHKGDVQQASQWVADAMKQTGLDNIEIMPTKGHPIVYGDWLHAKDKPTILIYGHYDVQPAVIEDGWDNDPFDPIERDGKIYARGASDDKGQFFIHLKAIEAILQTDGRLPVNVKLIIEGEEEIGSPNLPEFISQYRDKLIADACVISDTGMGDISQPVIYNALRGLVAMELVVTGPAQDLHSGGYGGAIHNPAQAVAEIVAQLHDKEGNVTVPQFYDDVFELTDAIRAEMQPTNVSDEKWLAQTGAPKVWGVPEYTIRERIGARPTLEINGIASGFYGEGIKTVLPARAIAKITCRLVPDQNPQKIYELIRDYIAEITPDTVKSELRRLVGNSDGVVIETETPAMQAAISAYEKGWGATPIFMRGGGTLPIIADIQRELDVPVLMMGFGLSTDGAHGPNESFTISMFHKGIKTMIHFFDEIAQVLN